MNERAGSAKAMMVASVLLATGVAAGCSSSSSDTSANAPASTAADDATLAKQAFWTTLNAGDFHATMTAHERMIAAFEAHPEDDELARLIGFVYVLPIEQGGADEATTRDLFGDAVRYAKLAVDIPHDPQRKLYNSAFWAGLTYTQAGFAGDAATEADARATLDEVVASMPAFGLLTRADVMIDSPVESPDFATGLESYFRFYEQCSGAKLDRARPDLTPVLNRPFADASSTCGNSAHAPHGVQGVLLNFADALVKNGQAEAARPVYETIQRSEGFATWPFASVVADRLASDLAARTTAYTSGDPRARPRIGAGCFSCHQG